MRGRKVGLVTQTTRFSLLDNRSSDINSIRSEQMVQLSSTANQMDAALSHTFPLPRLTSQGGIPTTTGKGRQVIAVRKAADMLLMWGLGASTLTFPYHDTTVTSQIGEVFECALLFAGAENAMEPCRCRQGTLWFWKPPDYGSKTTDLCQHYQTRNLVAAECLFVHCQVGDVRSLRCAKAPTCC